MWVGVTTANTVYEILNGGHGFQMLVPGNPAADTVLQAFDVEVDEQSDAFPTEFPFKQTGTESGMHLVGSAQHALGYPTLNQIVPVSTVRIRALRGVAFGEQLAGRQ